MKSTGIMEQIRTLLLQGKSGREVIEMGFAPGSVYGAQRQWRRRVSAPSEASRPGETKRTAVAMGDAGETAILYHAEPPIACPGCGRAVVHWGICTLCSRFLPCECACPDGSSSKVHGYTLAQLQASPGPV